MSHSSEMDRPEHRIHHMHIPEGHAHLDQKHHKAGRSPMLPQLPQEAGLENPEVSPGLNSEQGGGMPQGPGSY